MIKAIGFDLGGTLIEYKNVPFSWKALYREALILVAENCGILVNDELLKDAEAVLSKYNTRENPREEEVKAEVIFEDVFSVWEIEDDHLLQKATNTFFEFFQGKTELFEDTLSTLLSLKNKNIRIGILTDVPYGMSREFVNKDISLLNHLIDCIKTSVEVGLRKPNVKGFIELANCLGVHPSEMIYVGDEEKDIAGAKEW